MLIKRVGVGLAVSWLKTSGALVWAIAFDVAHAWGHDSGMTLSIALFLQPS